MVPTAAVQRGPVGPFVYVVKDDSTVGMRPVTHHQAGRPRSRARLRRARRRPRRDDRLRPPHRRHARRRCRPRRSRHRADLVGGHAGAAQGRHQRIRGETQGSGERSKGRTPGGGLPGTTPMSVSSPFIYRPIATSLLGIATLLGGLLGYFGLPVSSLPQVDFPTHPGHHATARRQSRHHGVAGDGAARAQVRADPVARADDVVEFVRRQPDHAAVRSRPRHRRRRRRTCRPRSTPRARRCRATCRIRRSTRRSIRPTRRSSRWR